MKKKLAILGIIVCVIILVLIGTYQLMNARTFQVFGELTNRVQTDKKVVALTFDDGPTQKVDDILSLLDKYNVKATFFLIGREIENNTREAKKIVADGHQVGNHSYSHQRMIFKSPTFIKQEIEKTDKLIRGAGFKGDIDFRPPYGKKLWILPYYLNQTNRETITWSIEPDIAVDKLAYVKQHITNGSIILLHPMYEEEQIEITEEIIQFLLEEDYEFVTVNELQNL